MCITFNHKRQNETHIPPLFEQIQTVRKNQKTEALKTSLMFATLARTAAADSNVKDVEVKKVQEIMRRVASTECSAASINVAAKSHLFEKHATAAICFPCSKVLI